MIRLVLLFLLVLAIITAGSSVYLDIVLAREQMNVSVLDHLGAMASQRTVLHDFSWPAWWWLADKSFGVPRIQELGTLPMYPVQWALLWLLPAAQAWHMHFVLATLLKVAGLVLLFNAFRWPGWVIVLASAGAMLAPGAALTHFADLTILWTGALVPLSLWLSLEASRRTGFSGWDVAWACSAAMRAVSWHPQWGMYYEILIALFTLRVEWGGLRARWPVLGLRYVAYGLLVMPWFLPGVLHYDESARRHVEAFEDWHFRRAYLWWKYGFEWIHRVHRSFFVPLVVWLALAAAAVVGRVRGTIWWPVLGAYFVFTMFHAVPYLAFPMWLTGKALLPFRIPERSFDPFTWITIWLVAEVAVRQAAGWRKTVLSGLLVVSFLGCVWTAPRDYAESTLGHWEDWPLPERLAAHVRGHGGDRAIFPVGVDKFRDPRANFLNSNLHIVFGVQGAQYLGEVPNLYYGRAFYRVPGMVNMQISSTPLSDWEGVVDVYGEMGVRWVFWTGAGAPAHPRLTFVAEEHGVRLFEIVGARPRVYALDRVRSVDTPVRPIDATTLVYGLPGLGPFCYGCPAAAAATPAADVRLDTTVRAGDVRVNVESSRGTLVVLGETRSRGWRATVDGAPATIHPVNEVFQGVAVPPGRHRIHWTFASPGFGVGVGLFALGVVLLLVCWAIGPRFARLFAAAGVVVVLTITGAPSAEAAGVREIENVRLTHPTGVAAAPDGTIWITSRFADILTRFDPRDGSTREIRLGLRSQPVGVLATPTGAIWFAASGLGRVGRYDPRQDRLDEFAVPSLQSNKKLSGFPAPWSLAFDATRGQMWFTEHSGGLVATVDAAAKAVRRGFVVRELGAADYARRPDGIAVDGAGRVWIAELGMDRLARIDPRDHSTHHVALAPGARPRDVVRAPDGALWVTLSGTHEVLRLDPANDRQTTWRLPSAPRSHPHGIAVDGQGGVWVSESGAGRIVRLDPRTGQFQVVVLPTPAARVRALAVDAAGRVWFVGSSSGRLGVIEP